MKTKKTTKREADPPIFCRYSELIPYEKLKWHPKNPNHHPQKQINLLAQVIEENGWRNPIVVSTRSGFIVKGHGRWLAAKRLKVKSVPVEYQDYKNDTEELADLIADNQIAELSTMDEATSAGLLEEVNFQESKFSPLFSVPEKLTETTEKQIKKLKYGHIGIALTSKESEFLKNYFDSYARKNGNLFGCLAELLENGAKNYIDLTEDHEKENT